MSFWELFFLLFIFLPLVMLWVFGLVDLFRRDDLRGWAKAVWAIVIVVLPVIGLLVYFIMRPPSPEEKRIIRSERAGAGSPDVAGQLTSLAELRDRGVLTEEEFAREKERLLES